MFLARLFPLSASEARQSETRLDVAYGDGARISPPANACPLPEFRRKNLAERRKSLRDFRPQIFSKKFAMCRTPPPKNFEKIFRRKEAPSQKILKKFFTVGRSPPKKFQKKKFGTYRITNFFLVGGWLVGWGRCGVPSALLVHNFLKKKAHFHR